jgi:two-component system, LytTR family, response regulator
MNADPAPLRVLIVDDERAARVRLRRLLETEPDLAIVAECADGPAAVETAKLLRPDLLLLDVQIPGMDGFDVLRALPEDYAPAIVFVTAFDQHAVRAFEACALDYLLKPVAPSRLARALARVRERRAMLAAATRPPEPPVKRRFVVRGSNRVSVVGVAEIEWIEAAGNYAILHTAAGNHILRETMGALEESLPPNEFMRINRGVIVRLALVRAVRPAQGETPAAVMLAGGVELPLTRGLREVQERLKGG